MSDLKALIDNLCVKYGTEARIVPAKDDVDLSDIPEPLADFYSIYDSVCFPFGRIDSPVTSILCSQTAEPFRSEGAFCFGGDLDGFCFWLCALGGPDEDGFVFTSWDHELDDEIEYAFRDLAGLLLYAEKEYLAINSRPGL